MLLRAARRKRRGGTTSGSAGVWRNENVEIKEIKISLDLLLLLRQGKSKPPVGTILFLFLKEKTPRSGQRPKKTPDVAAPTKPLAPIAAKILLRHEA